MPPALVDVLAVAGLLVVLAVAFVHPPGAGRGPGRPGRPPAAVLATGAVDAAGAVEQVRLLLPVVAFLVRDPGGRRAVRGRGGVRGGRRRLVARASGAAPRRMLVLTSWRRR